MSNYPSTPSFGGSQSFTQQWQYQRTLPTDNRSSLPSYPLVSDSSTTTRQNAANYVAPSYSNSSFPPLPQLPGLTMTSDNSLSQHLPGTTQDGLYTEGSIQSQTAVASEARPSWALSSSLTNFNQSAGANSTSPNGLQLRDAPQQQDISHTTISPNTQSAEYSYSDDVDREEGEVSENDNAGHTTAATSHHALSNLRGPNISGEEVIPLFAPSTIDLQRSSMTEKSKSMVDVLEVNPEIEISNDDISAKTFRSGRNLDTFSDKPLMSTSAQLETQNLPDRLSGSRDNKQSSHNPSSTLSADVREDNIGQFKGRTPAQIRILAHGALLSLVAHNIRFNELVGENINPTILRQLYEEIGIKIPQADPSSPSGRAKETNVGADVGRNAAKSTPETVQNDGSRGLKATLRPQQLPKSQPESVVSNVMPRTISEKFSTQQSAISSDTGKPLERKDVIARMLAAKSKKPSVVSTKKRVDVATSTPKTKSHTSEGQTAAKLPTETQVKEKSKAQTELARQRMEQLKKGLRKLQQRTPTAANSPKLQDHGQLPLQSGQVGTMQYPLPERPPSTASPLSRLPGLVMTITESPDESPPSKSPVSAPNRPQATSKSSRRKRPRASDFDDTVPASKRTFSADDRLVIDISEDESMYGDDEGGDDETASRAAYILKNGSTPSSEANNLTTPDGSGHKSETVSLRHSHSSSSQQLSQKSNDPEDLRLKDLEIMAMRKRIAELESRQRARLAASVPHSPGSPSRPTSTSHVDASLETAPLSQNPVVAVAPPLSLRSAIMTDQKASSIAYLAPSTDPSTNGQPQTDTSESQLDQPTLHQYQKVENLVPFEIANDQAARDPAIEEGDSSGVQVDDSNGLHTPEGKLEQPQPLPLPLLPPATLEVTNDENFSTTLSVDNFMNDTNLAFASNGSPTHSYSASLVASQSDDGNGSSSPGEETRLEAASDSAMDESLDSVKSMSLDSSTQAVLSTLEQNADQNDPMASREAYITLDQSMTSPEPHRGQEVRSRQHSEHPIEAVSYPADIAFLDDSDMSKDMSATSELYEPPEPPNPSEMESTLVALPSPQFSSPFPHLSDQVGFDHNNKVSTSLPEASRGLTGINQEFKDTERHHIDILQNMRHTPPIESTYIPYTSPLKLFNAYRFHPNFLSETLGGYRSLTYSHNIDITKQLCPFEASGGICNDHSCSYQHWRDMEISDDKVLIQMGSVREGQTAEEQNAYLEGLKTTINDMQRDKVKDFETVAAEIAAYRRRYLHDPSRILSL